MSDLKESETEIIISALRKAANDIHDPCGVTSGVMMEAADRLEELKIYEPLTTVTVSAVSIDD